MVDRGDKSARQMLSLEGDANAAALAYGSASGQGFQGLYRTDSPMQYSSGPGAETFEMDLGQHHAHPQQHQQAAADGMYAVGLADAQAVQYTQGFYQHPHHSL